MAEMIDETAAVESTTVGVFRTAATVKGGRRFSFSSLVVVGDRNGRVGFGYGKADQVPPAIEKAQKEGRRRMKPYPLQGRTIPHAVTGRFGACKVRLVPASPGTGVIAGAAVRAPLEMLGVQDCMTKSYGSNNSKNLVKAVMNGLDQLRSKQEIESLRGVKIEKTIVEEAIERGQAYFGGAEQAQQEQATAESQAKPEKKNGKPKGKSTRTDRKPPKKTEEKVAGEDEVKNTAETAPEAAETQPESETTETVKQDPESAPAEKAGEEQDKAAEKE